MIKWLLLLSSFVLCLIFLLKDVGNDPGGSIIRFLVWMAINLVVSVVLFNRATDRKLDSFGYCMHCRNPQPNHFPSRSIFYCRDCAYITEHDSKLKPIRCYFADDWEAIEERIRSVQP